LEAFPSEPCACHQPSRGPVAPRPSSSTIRLHTFTYHSLNEMQEVASRPDSKPSCRTRPNLVKACKKTKLCNFNLRGACSRGGDCTFAHDPSELQSLPDLHATKLCPKMLSLGYCANITRCKYAHSELELREISVEDETTPATRVPLFLSTFLDGAKTETETSVTSRLHQVSTFGALNLSEMILHLTSLFTAMFEMQPLLANRVGSQARTLAEATAAQVWADAGLDKDALMTFSELVQWCNRNTSATQSLPPFDARLLPMKTRDRMESCLDDQTWSASSEEDDWSRRSTEEGWSHRSDASGDSVECSTPSGADPNEENDPQDAWALYQPLGVEVRVKNTFLSFRELEPADTPRRRALSVPAGLDSSTRNRSISA